jgi:hypothetical protein
MSDTVRFYTDTSLIEKGLYTIHLVSIKAHLIFTELVSQKKMFCRITACTAEEYACFSMSPEYKIYGSLEYVKPKIDSVLKDHHNNAEAVVQYFVNNLQKGWKKYRELGDLIVTTRRNDLSALM